MTRYDFSCALAWRRLVMVSLSASASRTRARVLRDAHRAGIGGFSPRRLLGTATVYSVQGVPMSAQDPLATGARLPERVDRSAFPLLKGRG